METAINNSRFANRLTAFFVMLAMMLAMVTPLAWADTTAALNGDITISPSILEVGEKEEAHLTYSLGAAGEAANINPRLYITSANGDVSQLIKIGSLPSWEIGASFQNKYATYTLQKDGDGYYLQIDGLGVGSSLNTDLTANFLGNVPDGTVVNFKLCNGAFNNPITVNDTNAKAEATLTAKATAQWHSYKSGDVTSITVNSNATILANNATDTTTITYKIKESSNSDGTSSLDDGDAVITSYTAYDTVTLPTGAYIAAGNDATAAIKTAYSINGADYSIDNVVTDSNGNVTGFTAYWTVTNNSTTTQLTNAEYTATLDLSKINVSGTVSSSVITNELETEYKWNTANGEKNAKTDSSTVTTTVVPDGRAIAGVTKDIRLIKDGNTGGLTWEWNLYNAKVTKGDKILYYITVTNGSETEQTYALSDELSKYGLKYIERANIPTDENGVNDRQYLSGETETITIAGHSTAYLCVWAEVTEDTDKPLTNTINVTSGNEKMSASATVTQEKTAPQLAITKTIGGLADGNIYEAGDEFYYDITVKNTGSATAEKIELSDVLPNGVTYALYEVTTGKATVEESNGTVSGIIENFEPNKEVTVRVKVKVVEENTPSYIMNTATAIMYDSDNSELDTKSASVTANLNTASVANLTISKTTPEKIVKKDDTVEYTITVTNPYWRGTLENATFNVTDIIPNGLEYESNTSDGTVTENTDGKVTIKFDNRTFKPGETLTFTVTCKVTGDANSSYVNEAYISDVDGNKGNSDSDSSITPEGTSSSSSILVEKDALVNGKSINGKTVAANTPIEFRIKIINNGTEALTKFEVTDKFEGDYQGINFKVYQYSVSEGSSLGAENNSALFKGEMVYLNNDTRTTTWYFEQNGSKNWAYQDAYHGNPSISIAPNGGYIILSYTVTTASDFSGGSNTAILKAGNDTSTSTVTYGVGATPEPTGEPSASNAQLEITKQAIDKKAYTVSEENPQNDLDGYRFGYTVTVTNTSDEDYTTNNAVFTDKIPSGFALSINKDANQCSGGCNADNDKQVVFIKGWGKNKWDKDGVIYYVTKDIVETDWLTQYNITMYVDNTSISSNPWTTLNNVNEDNPDAWGTNSGDNSKYLDTAKANYKIPGNELKISFDDTLTILAGQSLTFTYYLVPTDDEISAIINEVSANGGLFDDRSYKNEAKFTGGTAFKDKSGKAVKEIKAVETVQILSPKIHPGIEKTPLYAIGSTDEKIKPFSDTIPQLQDTFVWTVTVYNKTDIAGGGKKLTNYTVTDAYPQYMQYGGKEYANQNLTYKATCTKYGSNGAETTSLGYIEPDDNGTFKFSGDSYALEPGEKLVFTVITAPQSETSMDYGMYTNTVTLKTGDQKFDKNNVTEGDVNAAGDAITATASIPLYLIYTTSSKSITVGDNTISSDKGANTIGASMGDTVTYTLSVTNHDTNNELEDFTIIDRLPYSGDGYVIANASRGSVFPIKYAEKMKAVITSKDGDEKDVTKSISTSFASGSGERFTALDTDWYAKDSKAASTKVAWTDTVTESTNLVRFSLGGEKTIPAGATITITFEGKIPDYVMNSGENNVAWNSFGYYFNSGAVENMIAEPSKVGVWVEDTSTGGSILVKKIYYTNLPTLERTFHFALYAGEYNETTNNTPLEVKSITMTGSTSGVQATTYFTDITYDADGTAFYIYESDIYGKPLEATETTSASYTDSKPADGNTTYEKEETYSNEVATKTTTGADGKSLTMDNSAQLKAAQAKSTWAQYEKEVAAYNSNYLVWHKDLSSDCTKNSAIFTNSYYAGTTATIMGPFYADVPTNQAVASSSMTSTRPDSFKEGAIKDTVASDNRTENFAEGTTYDATKETTAYGGKYKHTIATGFLAKIKAEGEYTLDQVKWNITTSNPNENTTGVFVRLKTTTVSEGEVSATVMYLDDFDVFEGDDTDNAELFDVGGFDDIGEDETFTSSYTVEERAAMIAESLGLDPESVLYDDYGCPYVVVDEDLASEAFELSEEAVVSENSAVTTQDSFTNSTLSVAGFDDAETTEGYAIFKLSGTKQYSMEIKDNLPHITLAEGAEAYVGIIIDQLYDQKATAELTCNEDADYGDEMLELADKSSNDKYVGVKSPFQKGDFSIGALMKLTSGKAYDFTGFAGGTYKSDITNANNTMKLTATSGKAIVVEEKGTTEYGTWSGTKYVNLKGSGRNDYRSIVVNVAENTTLEIHARSGKDGEERTLVIEDSKGNKQTLTVPAKKADKSTISSMWNKTITVENAGLVYIYSQNSGIDIFEIVVK